MQKDKNNYKKPEITKLGDLKEITKKKSGVYDGDGPGFEDSH